MPRHPAYSVVKVVIADGEVIGTVLDDPIVGGKSGIEEEERVVGE